MLIKYHKSQTLRRRDLWYILSSGSDFNKMIFRMGGMNHPGMSMDNRMMGINPPMMTNQGMSGHHGYGQGGYPWPRPYHWDDTVAPISRQQSDSSVSQKVIFHCGCTKIEISSAIHQTSENNDAYLIHTRKRCQSSRLQAPSSGDNFRYVPSSFLANEFFVSA